MTYGNQMKENRVRLICVFQRKGSIYLRESQEDKTFWKFRSVLVWIAQSAQLLVCHLESGFAP